MFLINGRIQRYQGGLESAGPYKEDRNFHFYRAAEVRYVLGKGLLRAQRKTMASESDLRLKHVTVGLSRAQEFDDEFDCITGCDWIRPNVWGHEPY